MGTTTTFAAVSARTSYTGDPAKSGVTVGNATTSAQSNDVAVTVSGTLNSTFAIADSGEGASFTSADLISAPLTTSREFIYRIEGSGGRFSQLTLLNDILSANSTTDPSAALIYVSYANWLRGDSTTGEKRLTSAVFGFTTGGADVPVIGSRAYGTLVSGTVIRSFPGGATTTNPVAGGAAVTANFATGLVWITLNLSTCPAPRCDNGMVIGTFTSQALIVAGQNSYSGTLVSGGAIVGSVSGHFYGPTAQEFGFTFASAEKYGAGADERVVGNVTGSVR